MDSTLAQMLQHIVEIEMENIKLQQQLAEREAGEPIPPPPAFLEKTEKEKVS